MTAWRTPASAAARKKESKNRVRTAMPSLRRRGVNAGSSSASSISPFIILMKASTPTALTSGSAKGSSISGFGPFDAIARRAATAVAVAPTLDARSQLSPSCRLVSLAAMVTPLSCESAAGCDDGDDVAERGQFVVGGEPTAVVSEQFPSWAGAHLPTPTAEILGDVVALALVEQPRHVNVTAQIGPPLVHRPTAFGHRRTGIRVIFGGQLASGGAERGDVVEKPILGFRRQVHQQPFGAPGRRFGVVEAAFA